MPTHAAAFEASAQTAGRDLVRALHGSEAPLDLAAVAEQARTAILAWCTHPARLDEWRRGSRTLGRDRG